MGNQFKNIRQPDRAEKIKKKTAL